MTAAARQHGRESVKSRAAQDAHEHGLSLVVGMMCRRQHIGANALKRPPEKIIAEPARRKFQRLPASCGFFGHRSPSEETGNAPFPAKVSHKRRIFCRGRTADAMVKMCHGQDKLKLLTKLHEDIEKGQRIGPARAGHEHVHALLQESLRLGVLRRIFYQPHALIPLCLCSASHKVIKNKSTLSKECLYHSDGQSERRDPRPPRFESVLRRRSVSRSSLSLRNFESLSSNDAVELL